MSQNYIRNKDKKAIIELKERFKKANVIIARKLLNIHYYIDCLGIRK